MVLNKIIVDENSADSIEDTNRMAVFPPVGSTTAPVLQPIDELRAVFQQGIQQGTDEARVNQLIAAGITGKLDTDLGNVGTPADAAAFRTAIGAAAAGDAVDITGKLNIDLQNADDSLTTAEQNLFANRVGLLRNTIDNLANTGLISEATRQTWRTLLNVAVAPTTYPTEGTTTNITARRGEFIHFSDTGHTYLCNQAVTLQGRLIAQSDLFSQIHLDRATEGEMRAGTETGLRANSPALIKEAIDALVQYANVNGRPFINVAPGAAFPTPTSSNEDLLLVAGTAQGRTLYHQQVEHGSDLSVTYREFNSSDLSSGNYQGEVNYIENLPSDANNGDVYFVRSDHNLRIWNDTATQWGHVAWLQASTLAIS